MHSPCATRSTVKVVEVRRAASSAVGIASSTRLTRMPSRRSMWRLEQRDGQPRDRHADRAGVHRKAHRGRRHLIGARERRQDRLGGEQIDHGEKRRQADDERPAQAPSIDAVRVLRQRASCGTSATWRLHSRYSAASSIAGSGSCRITPSSGSNSLSHGACSSARMVLRVARLPALADAGRAEVDVLGVVLVVELRRQQAHHMHDASGSRRPRARAPAACLRDVLRQHLRRDR